MSLLAEEFDHHYVRLQNSGCMDDDTNLSGILAMCADYPKYSANIYRCLLMNIVNRKTFENFSNRSEYTEMVDSVKKHAPIPPSMIGLLAAEVRSNLVIGIWDSTWEGYKFTHFGKKSGMKHIIIYRDGKYERAINRY